MIQLTKVAVFRDGGTIKCVDSEGVEYYIDHRIGTTTPGNLYNKYPGYCDAKIVKSMYNLMETPEELINEMRKWADVPVMDNSDEYMDGMIADVINRPNHRVGVKLLFIWWTQVVAFKTACDALAVSSLHDRRHIELLKSGATLFNNMNVAAQDLEAWKADNEHVTF